MRNNIAAQLEIQPRHEYADLLNLEELGHTLGLSKRDTLMLTQREDFPEPVMRLHRYEANETLPQPRRVWDRADIERWAEERGLSLPSGQTIEK